MPWSQRNCPTPGCDATVTGRQRRCPEHEAQAEQDRGTARDRGYGKAHQRFRSAVLRKSPRCVICGAPATIADHYPRSRRQLVADGDNPNDPRHGRGLCASCHSRETTQRQPGGFLQR